MSDFSGPLEPGEDNIDEITKVESMFYEPTAVVVQERVGFKHSTQIERMLNTMYKEENLLLGTHSSSKISKILLGTYSKSLTSAWIGLQVKKLPNHSQSHNN